MSVAVRHIQRRRVGLVFISLAQWLKPEIKYNAFDFWGPLQKCYSTFTKSGQFDSKWALCYVELPVVESIPAAAPFFSCTVVLVIVCAYVCLCMCVAKGDAATSYYCISMFFFQSKHRIAPLGKLCMLLLSQPEFSHINLNASVNKSAVKMVSIQEVRHLQMPELCRLPDTVHHFQCHSIRGISLQEWGFLQNCTVCQNTQPRHSTDWDDVLLPEVWLSLGVFLHNLRLLKWSYPQWIGFFSNNPDCKDPVTVKWLIQTTCERKNVVFTNWRGQTNRM